MAGISLKLIVRKRWFYWPLFFTIFALGKLRILRDPARAIKWLVDVAVRFEVS